MNKTALITGTTSGIGKAFCNLLACENYNLILVARNQIELEKQTEDFKAQGVNVFPILCDLTTPNAAQTIFDVVINNNMSIDVLINNAGFNETGKFVETYLTKELDMIRIHIQILTELTKLFLPQMIKQKSGKILNLGSTGSYMPCPYDVVYAATKAYVLSFSNGLYHEVKGTGVTITCLCPGATKTKFADKAGLTNSLLFKLFVMQPSHVALIGYKAMLKGKRVVTAGLYNKLLILSTRLLPISAINPIAKFMLQK